MKKFKIFVDGQEGTTGLEINERLKKRDDIEVLIISADKRKDLDERAKFINQADIVFLCLPDDAARESVTLLNNNNTRVIDASTAHRTADDWAYGMPELSAEYRKNIETASKVANPGCYPTGFNMLMYPLVKFGIIKPDYQAACHAVTGYSGGGKGLIERFESEENKDKLRSPCFYALGLQHKHLPEMQKHSGLNKPPIFTPIVGNYYRGMTVAIPLAGIAANLSVFDIHSLYMDWYQGSSFVRVIPVGVENVFEWGFMNAESCNHTNNIEILVFGHDEQILVAARLDNLGKGASGAAVQNMNIMLGLDETYGLI